ncbi:MAG TPA: hypothetical protein DCQ31_05315 [Bacteroidales bacterium]|nr:hypothetical protein [Bacteroidales bacterium]
MRKINLTAAVLICFSVLALQAQEQLKHEKVRYIDKNGRLFVNRHLPMYLFLGNNANGTDLHRMKSESSPQYSNPFYFDTDGYNTIRTPSQVDTITKKTILPVRDIIFEIYADGLAPQSAIALETKNKFFAKGTNFYGKDLVVHISSKDAGAGLSKIYYSIDKAAYIEYTAPFEYDKEGLHTISYYAVDNVGNAAEPGQTTFTVDRTPPLTISNFVGIQKDGTLSPSTKLELVTTDNITGVKGVYYQIGTKVYPYTTPISLGILNDGKHRVSFYAVDNVNNNNAGQEDGKVVKMFDADFNMDKTAPVSTLTVVGDQFEGQYHYVSPRTKISLSATDQTGVFQIRYGVDKAAGDVFASDFSLNDKQGFQKINFLAEDEVKNISTVNSKTVYMDKVPPVTGINYKTPQFFNRDTLFINRNTEIGFFSRDTESGVLKTEYKVDNGEFLAYTDKFKIDMEGFHTIEFKSTDKVNNVENIKKSQVLVDNNAPEIYLNFSIMKVGERPQDGKSYAIYPSYTRMYIGATDKYSGTETIFYSIDGGPMQNYATATKNVSEANLFTQNKFYTIKVIAKDKLGNESIKEVSFFIDDNPGNN